MDTAERNEGVRGRKVLAAVLWVAAGFVLAALVLVDPLGFHPLDEWLRGEGNGEVTTEAAEGQLWTCGMHPQVIQDEPGQCPICRMDLVPLVQEEGMEAMGSTGGMEDGGEGHTHTAEGGMAEGGAMESPDPSSSGEGEVLFYRNPMDPTVTSPVPAKDEMGMDYVPVYADEVEAAKRGGPVVRIDPAVVQNINVQTEPVERRDLSHPVRTVGYLEYDQERMVSVTTKYSGWVEKVEVNYVGERVRRGQPLFEVYSPELVQTQQELLSALDFARRMEVAPGDAQRRARALVEAARTRLSYWDISPAQIAGLEASGEVFRTLTVEAPAGGVVMKRMPGLEGMAVRPGMELFHIADLSSLWLSVEVYEDQVAWIREGTPARVTFTYFPGETFRGTVRFIDPEFSEETRTLPVKLALPNPDGRLRPGMFATVVFEPQAVEDALTVPSLSVLRTGERNVVVVQVGEGRFAPREVVLGHEGEVYVEVLSGLSEGQQVVTSAQFLLDSESSLREAIQKMIAARTAGHSH